MTLKSLNEKIDRWHWGIMIFIFVLAFTLRIVGIDWGMPHNNLHPDEVIIFDQAYQCTLNHNFEVKQYLRPNHVTIKLNTLLYTGIQEFYFAPQGKNDFALNYSENFAMFTTASRIMIALFSMGTVILAYLTAAFWGKRQALFATLLFAIFPSFIEHSHYITPDIPLLFFLMGVLWAALRYMNKPAVCWLFWMSFFTALATCEKYPGIYGCVIIAIAVCVTQIKKPIKIVKDGFLAIIFVVLGILAVSPILIIDLKTVLEVMAGQNKQHHLGADGLNFGQTLIYYAKTAAEHLGLVLTLSSIYGIVKSFKENIKSTLILLTFLIYIFPISMLSVHWERYTLPIYAAGLWFGAFGIVYLFRKLQGILEGKTIASWAVVFLLVLLPAGSLMAGSMAMTGKFLAPDSRILLQDTFAERNITTSNTSYDCNTPLDPGGFYGAWSNYEGADPDKFKYGSTPPYVMTSSAQRDLYLAADPQVYGWIADFYRRLDEEYALVYYYPVENPRCHFVEFQNIWYSARSVYRYMRGTATGYEIRLYQRLQ